MQLLGVSCAVRPIYGSLGAKGLRDVMLCRCVSTSPDVAVDLSACFRYKPSKGAHTRTSVARDSASGSLTLEPGSDIYVYI
jgi:hypothetical protein